jgi:cell division cycle 2-like protein
MGGGDVCTMADERDDGTGTAASMAATRLAELCAMIDDHAAAGTMSEKRVATICAMIEECNDDVEEASRRRSSRRRSGRWRRRVGGTSSTRCYRQIGRISSGGFGVVVKAEHRDTGQTVAMKTLFRRRRSADDDAADLLREASFMAACRGNPYLVGLHGVARNPRTKQYSLVMEYVGPSLSAALAEHVERHGGEGYAEATVRRIMRQLLTGAAAMHERRIIHRDIKASNILVGGDGDVVKICDFGLAMSTAEAAAPYRRVGTDGYMACPTTTAASTRGRSAASWRSSSPARRRSGEKARATSCTRSSTCSASRGTRHARPSSPSPSS